MLVLLPETVDETVYVTSNTELARVVDADDDGSFEDDMEDRRKEDETDAVALEDPDTDHDGSVAGGADETDAVVLKDLDADGDGSFKGETRSADDTEPLTVGEYDAELVG
jgi:hypothetical protein